jgi:DNA-binding NtrC family response regulator
MVKRYVIVGNEAQIIRELSTHKPIMRSQGAASMAPQPPEVIAASAAVASYEPGKDAAENHMPSLLEIGKRAAMLAEREAIERVLTQTRWNRRQAAKILKISYKALLNKLKAMEENDRIAQNKQRPA